MQLASLLNDSITLSMPLPLPLPLLLLEQDMQLASHLNVSVTLSVPLLLNGPPFPSQLGVPVPAAVSLDLASCIACIALANDSTVLYIADLHLTGLECPMPHNSSSSSNSSNSSNSSSSSGGGNGSSSSSSGSGDGTDLSLPLWAFEFDRLPGVHRVFLRNVTLTLPWEEYRLLLAGLAANATAAGPGAGASGQQQQQGTLGWSIQVGWCRPGWGVSVGWSILVGWCRPDPDQCIIKKQV